MPESIYKNFSYQCAYNYAQLQHITFLITFPVILQTIITVQLLCMGGKRESFQQKFMF